MRLRTVAIVGAMTALVTALITVSAGAANAATGPIGLQRLAAAQTKLLLGHLKTPVGKQTASPNRCNEGQDADGTKGTFLLPTLAGGSGNLTFNCHVEAREVLVDLGGAFATEDDRASDPLDPSLWTTANGDVLAFTKANLERICDDILPRFFSAPAKATVDGGPLPGATPISTTPFTSRIRPTTGQLYQDSVDLHHPGTLATTYCGWKARVSLAPGHHVITVDLSNVAGSATVFIYNINVED
jgi:hypothetical protein